MTGSKMWFLRIAVLFFFLVCGTLHADDLSVLGYGLVFWPAASVFILVLLLVSLFNGKALRGKICSRASLIRAAFTLIWAAAGMIFFPYILEGNRFRQLKALTLIPVEIVGGLGALIALLLLGRCVSRVKKTD